MKSIVLFAALLASAEAAGKIFATRRGSKHASHKLQAVDPASNIQFKLHFKHCNLSKLEAAATAVSDPENKRYGKFLSSTEACQMVQCPDTPAALAALSNFAAQADGAVMTVGCDHVKLSMSAGAAMKLMPELKLQSLIETKHTASSSKLHKSVIRASGDVVLPHHIAQYIQLVTGLTELRGDTKYRVQKYSPVGAPPKRKRSTNLKAAASSNSETVDAFTNFTDVVITPRVIRSLYSVPGGKLGAGIVADSTKSKHGNNGKNTIKNRQGIVAFNDYYTQSDLCAANTMLAHEDYWLNSVDSIVEYDGPEFDGTADQSESDLGKSLTMAYMIVTSLQLMYFADVPHLPSSYNVSTSIRSTAYTQYMLAMSGNVPTLFLNHAENEWMLDWSQQASSEQYSPDNGGPLV
eukprot:18342-Heterococcus_DN1.PRE.1